MPSPAEAWVASLSPWPEEFGLERMVALLDRLGNPQRAYRAIHVVGTNGKSTATRTIAALLRAEGLRTGAYTSPHVSGWGERIQVEGADVDLEAALARVRAPAEELGATQFEVLTAAALAEFAAREVDAAAVEAGLGGRHDATNVLDAPVVLLTNVGLEHTEVLGSTREAIAREKLAVVRPGATVVLGEPEWEGQAWAQGAREVVHGGAREAASAFLGRPVEHDVEAALAGRLERRGEEVRDGAHTPTGAAWLVERLPRRDYVVCASILSDKDTAGILAVLARAGRTLVATRSSNPRSLPAGELARRAEPWFERVEVVEDPSAALARTRALAGPGGPVLVTGSLYLLADLSSDD
jgi:dihydrofolate synthase / folylpolyglutamate synthase